MRTLSCSVYRNGLTPLLCILLGTSVLSAHHSFAAQYDADKPITLTGTVVRIEWTNPHFHFYVDEKDVSLKPGMTVTVQGWRARVEPNLVAAREVTFADGSKLTSGPPAGTGGQ
jgi:hypothetical protein